MTREEALTKIKELEEYIKKLDEELKLYDIVTYQDIEWYVIKIEEETVTLMSKNTIGECPYSDNNSNDWKDSNCREVLFEKLSHNNLKVMKVNYDENKFFYDTTRIPTLREIEVTPMEIRNCGEDYWTMTSSYAVSEDNHAACVYYVGSTGFLYYGSVSRTHGVRAVIKIDKEKLN